MGVSDLVFGSYTMRNKNRIKGIVSTVNSFSDDMEKITTDKTLVIYNGKKITVEEVVFYKKTEEFRTRLRNGETIEHILPEALAVVREATRRRLGMYPYDVQIEASIAMIGNFDGKRKLENGEVENARERVIAEMKTGEGKTLVQILVAYLNALEATKDEDKSKWKSVHVMTSNDALAKRDALENSKVFSLLGLSCSFVPSKKSVNARTIKEKEEYLSNKRKSYYSDIVYATTSTIAFDYLGDNTLTDPKERVINKEFGYAIVDEADDLLLDQAINPLILSGNVSGLDYEDDFDIRDIYKWATNFLYKNNGKSFKLFQNFEREKYSTFSEDYAYFFDEQRVYFSKRLENEIAADINGNEELFNLRYIVLSNCIRARHSFLKDKQYEVKVKGNTGEIILTDQNTGRRKYSNRYNDGMQEAIEAKEEYLENKEKGSLKRYHIKMEESLFKKAMCTYPDFLSLYEGRVCGMTGTSDIEEFKALYGFETYEVPSRKKNIRVDYDDMIYLTALQKYRAIIEQVKKCKLKLQPVLIGTTSIKESMILSSMLEEEGIRHRLLNASNEEEENKIIENAGLLGMVTVATNMAGRGTDIKLGEGVKEVGGLFVIGTSKNKSTRIDNQLRGRSGRQGDPGASRYFASFEDEIVKLYYSKEEIEKIKEKYKDSSLPLEDNEAKAKIDKAQIIRQSKDTSIRITNETFNKTFSEHKKIIYELRNRILDSDPKTFIENFKKIITQYVKVSCDNLSFDDLNAQLSSVCNIDSAFSSDSTILKKNLIDLIYSSFRKNFAEKGIKGKDVVNYVNDMKQKFLTLIDVYWIGHMQNLEDLKKEVGLIPDDQFKAYENRANTVFSINVMPSLLNEMITYAVNPNIKFGDYEIKYFAEDKEAKKIVV